ncbi:hypothetical protein [Nitriliruptor alkaliphilus]|uniref:hypothetical protein n=1 Tax=Nitriliruptor alkaliphilus TaxID=427918 RepID=UPI00069914FD|nr:hypothetical protein [Nitriliruptor alkaliphilus]
MDGTDGGRSAAGADLTAEVDLTAPPARTDLHDPRQRTTVEHALATVPGVIGARVVPGFERQVDELHVLTDLEKAPKQAVRDVQTVLMARFGVPTDHRVISVVQLDEQRIGGPSASRVTIDHVAVTHAGLEVRAEVALRDGDAELVGVGDGPSTPAGRHRAVGRATLDAVRTLLGDEQVVELEGTDVTEVLGHRVAISLVQFRAARGEHTVAGSALVRDATADAVARSVLDALNRTIGEAASR